MTNEEALQITELMNGGCGTTACYECELNECCKFKEAKETAITALEKQIPKKVIDNGHSERDCPNGCGAFWYKQQNFCEKCGQKLDQDEGWL
jgi:hypothetical protein